MIFISLRKGIRILRMTLYIGFLSFVLFEIFRIFNAWLFPDPHHLPHGDAVKVFSHESLENGGMSLTERLRTYYITGE